MCGMAGTCYTFCFDYTDNYEHELDDEPAAIDEVLSAPVCEHRKLARSSDLMYARISIPWHPTPRGLQIG